MNIPRVFKDSMEFSPLGLIQRGGAVWFLCFMGVSLGLGYLVLPGHVYLIALVLGMIFITGLVKPEYTFYLTVFVLVEEMVHIFITFAPVYEGRLYPYMVPLVATAIGFGAAKIVRNKELLRTPIDTLLLIVLIYFILSIMWAPVFIVGVMLLILKALNYVLFFVTKNILSNETVLRRTVAVWITAGVLAAAAITASQWVSYEKLYYMTQSSGVKVAFDEQVSRPAGLAGVDHVSGFVSISLFMALGMMAAAKTRKLKAVYFLIVMLMFYSIVLTTSRGVFIGVGGAYIFFITMHSHFKGKFLRYSFLFAAIVLFVILVAKPGFIDRMLIGFGYTGDLLFSSKSYTGTEADLSEGEGLSGMEIRMVWWKNALHEFSRNPAKLIFGLGVGGFYYYSAGGTTVTSPEVNGIAASFFYEMGLFGCVLFILLVLIIATYVYRLLRNATKTYTYYMFLGATSGLIAETGIHGLIDFDLTSYGSKYFWFPLGVVMAIGALLQKEREAAVLLMKGRT